MKNTIIIAVLLAGLVSCKKDEESKPTEKKCPVYEQLYLPSIKDVIRYHGPNCDSLYMDALLGEYEASMYGEFLHAQTGGDTFRTDVNSMHIVTLERTNGEYWIRNFWGSNESVRFYSVNGHDFFIKEFPPINRGGATIEIVSTDGKTPDGVVTFTYSHGNFGDTWDHIEAYEVTGLEDYHSYNYNLQFIKH